MRKPGHSARTALSILGGIVLLGLAFAVIPGLAVAFKEGLAAFGPWWSLAIVVLTFVITILTALKWRIVAKASVPESRSPLTDYVSFVSISTMVGLILPRQLGVIGSRTASLKYKKIADVPTGLQIVFSDLASDLVVPAALFGPSLLYLTGVISFRTTIVSCAAILTAAALTAPTWQSKVGIVLAAIGRRFRIRFQDQRDGNGRIPIALDMSATSARATFLLAVVKVSLIFLRAWFVALATDLPINLVMVAVAFPVVQLAFLVGITPAGLGIADWSWIGVLGAVGVSLEDAASFALLLRLANTASAVIVFSTVWAQRGFPGFRSKTQP